MAMRSVLTKAPRLGLRLRSPTGHRGGGGGFSASFDQSPSPQHSGGKCSQTIQLRSVLALYLLVALGWRNSHATRFHTGEEQVVYSKEEWECHQLRASFAAECKKFREMRHQQEAANIEAFREFAEQHKKGMEKLNRIDKAADAVIVVSAMLVIVSLITMI